MDYLEIIISAIIAIAGLIFGGVYWSKFKTIIKQVKVILDLIADAVSDDTITREELELIVKEAKILFALFKGGEVEALKKKITEKTKK